MKKIITSIFVITVLTQMAAPLSMIFTREKILQKGEMFKFKTRPIDPVDYMQGRYVRLGIESSFIKIEDGDIPKNLKRKSVIYATIDEDEHGFAYFSGWSLEPPISDHYLKTAYLGPRYKWHKETDERVLEGYNIEIPFRRYYMDENKAPKTESMMRNRSTTNCWANIRILHGNAVVESLFVNGESVYNQIK